MPKAGDTASSDNTAALQAQLGRLARMETHDPVYQEMLAAADVRVLGR